ncbi:MAG: twin-arginine translocation signal domain-containing protein, partial [Bryobacteraceae bacterium]
MKQTNSNQVKNRRSFLRGSFAAGAAVAGASVLGERKLFAQGNSSLTKGDVAILKFVAAAELIETDFWVQYAELGGVTTEPTNPYQLALQNLDPDGSQYISSNTLDELSHAEFLNAYLISKGEEPVDFDQFRTLPSSQADGAQEIGRLTNLFQL